MKKYTLRFLFVIILFTLLLLSCSNEANNENEVLGEVAIFTPADTEKVNDTNTSNDVVSKQDTDVVVEETSEELSYLDGALVIPEFSSIDGFDEIGFDLSGGERKISSTNYNVSFAYVIRDDFRDRTTYGRLSSIVRIKVTYDLPEDERDLTRIADRAEDTKASVERRLTDNTYEHVTGDYINYNAQATNRNVGNHTPWFVLLNGSYFVTYENLYINVSFSELLVDDYIHAINLLKNYSEEMIAKLGGEIEIKESVPLVVVEPDLNINGKLSFLGEVAANNMKVYINYYDDGENLILTEEVITDDEGTFKRPYPYTLENAYTIVLTTPLVYYDKDGNMISYICDKEKDIEEPILLYCGEYKVSSIDDLTINCDLYEGIAFQEDTQETSTEISVLYYQSMKEAIEYYSEVLKYDFTSRLPIRVILNETETATIEAMAYYNSDSDAIHVMKDYTKFDLDKTSYIVYHELSHYVMRMLYYPDHPRDSGIDTDISHGGYSNFSTGDSYSEGFAYFMEIIIGEHYYDTTYFPAEPNHKTWENSGRSETLAVASTLYDLVDSGPDDDDSVVIPLEELWEILNKNQRYFGDIYDDLKRLYPDLSDEIDQVFIDHGFFVVTDRLEEGADVYNIGEAFVDTNKNKEYDSGETFVDYNGKDEYGNYIQIYKEGYVIGYAGYYGNTDRK